MEPTDLYFHSLFHSSWEWSQLQLQLTSQLGAVSQLRLSNVLYCIYIYNLTYFQEIKNFLFWKSKVDLFA